MNILAKISFYSLFLSNYYTSVPKTPHSSRSKSNSSCHKKVCTDWTTNYKLYPEAMKSHVSVFVPTSPRVGKKLDPSCFLPSGNLENDRSKIC